MLVCFCSVLLGERGLTVNRDQEFYSSERGRDLGFRDSNGFRVVLCWLGLGERFEGLERKRDFEELRQQ